MIVFPVSVGPVLFPCRSVQSSVVQLSHSNNLQLTLETLANHLCNRLCTRGAQLVRRYFFQNHGDKINTLEFPIYPCSRNQVSSEDRKVSLERFFK